MTVLHALTGDGAPVQAIDEGQGPALLVVHPGSGDATSWEGVARLLTDEFRVVRAALSAWGRAGEPGPTRCHGLRTAAFGKHQGSWGFRERRGELEAAMILMVEHRVADYDAWKRGFDAHRDVQERYGATGYLLYRRRDNPAVVAVIMQFPSREQLEGFMSDPSLAEAMESSGVVGVPQIRTYTEAGAADLTRRMAA